MEPYRPFGQHLLTRTIREPVAGDLVDNDPPATGRVLGVLEVTDREIQFRDPSGHLVYAASWEAFVVAQLYSGALRLQEPE